jgi:hypothetical protein
MGRDRDGVARLMSDPGTNAPNAASAWRQAAQRRTCEMMGFVSVDVTVLYFAECPNWQTALERVSAAAGRTGVQIRVSTREVTSTENAELLGFTGSPTILVDGADPFARPGAVPALACRMYPNSAGLDGSPSVDQLADVLTALGV